MILLIIILGVVVVWLASRLSTLERRERELRARINELELAPKRRQEETAPPAAAPPPPATTPASRPVVEQPPVLLPALKPMATTGAPVPAPAPKPAVDWEQFMGAKLFAWLGGLALLLGVAFFVKYSFEHDLVPPEVRVTLGFLFGAALVAGGLRVPRERYGVTAFTLIGTGVVSLYAVTYAAHAFYRFPAFGLVATFVLMAGITALAFELAVRLEARVVAVLGMVGGFLTPVVLSTGVDNPAGLFGYIALLDLGLIAVALRRQWPWLVPLGAAGTVFMEIGWVQKFFSGDKLPVAMTVLVAFCGLFFAANEVARRWARPAREITAAAAGLVVAAFGFALYFLIDPGAAARPGVLFGGVFLADVCLLLLAWREEEMAKSHLWAGVATFGLLALWSAQGLTEALLPWALGCYVLHAVLHTGFAVMLERRRPAAAPSWGSQLFPPLALVLMLWPPGMLESVGLAFWPAVLVVDLLAIGLALLCGSLTVVAAVIVLTLLANGVWLWHLPATPDSLPGVLLVTAGFAVMFFAAGVLLPRWLGARAGGVEPRGSAAGGWADRRVQVPALAALLPFVLLALAVQRLPLPDPTLVYGVALLLVLLACGLGAGAGLAWLPACALAGLALVEYAWRNWHPLPAQPAVPLAWYGGFALLFAVHPFLLRRKYAAQTGPWAAAALAGVVQFPLVYQLAKHSWEWEWPGLIPAGFAVPPLVSLALVRRGTAADEGARLNQMAWYGAAVLFFVTLIIPVQFERHWVTLGWALEGAALLWLFHRVPHPGLRMVGVGLLVVCFVRLALHPVVLTRHTVGESAPWNWQLYTYGVVTLCLWSGARLLEPGERMAGRDVRSLLNALGVVLAFLLLNIELAEVFGVPGQRVRTFEFTGNFARDMATTIGWALFALGLLLASVWKDTRAGRYAALGLLGAALLKLFLHDLAQLGALYRIGALFAVAVIAILASVIYQRFVPARKTPPTA